MDPHLLIEAMSRETDDSCKAIIAEAQAKANVLMEDARREAARRRETALAEARRKLDDLVRIGLDRAKAQAARVSLETEDEIVAEINKHVHEALIQIAAGPGFREVLLSLLTQAMARTTDGKVIVHAPQAHAAACADWLKAHGFMTADVQPSSEITDGVLIEDQARSYRITNTLSRRYERMASDARRFAVSQLFGERAGL